MRATIVGAGIGGLCTAIGLRDAGWDVSVRERWPEVVGLGAALGLWPSARQALADLNLGAALEAAWVRPGSAGIYAKDGRPLIQVPADSKRVPPVRLVSRRRLMSLLMEAADGIDIQTEAAVDAQTVSREREGCDLLVGADGLRSAVRAAFFDDATRPRYSGMVAWRGIVDFEAPDQGETWGDGSLFGLTPVEPGRTNFYAAVPEPEGELGTFDGLRSRFREWRDPIPAVLAAADEDAVLRNPIYDLAPRLRSYVRPGPHAVALLGDAAHAMTPNLGRGACEAILDSASLVRGLADYRSGNDVDAALVSYDAARRRASQRAAARSAQLMRVARATRFTWLRDGIVGTAGRFVH